LKLLLGIPMADLGMLGRWVGHFPRGRFAHDSIAKAEPIRGERAIGWLVHYAIGIAFAAALLAIMGLEWAHRPTFLPPVLFGVLTVLIPFVTLQPAMGAGIAASKTPKPNVARLRSFTSHTIFGIGMYLSAWVVANSH
jgi:Protein of unknown function (DUF2938)